MGPSRPQVLNVPGESNEFAHRWVSKHMTGMPAGGVWVVPRSVATVFVVSKDPPIAAVRTIIPDPRLIDALVAAGWTVQHSQVTQPGAAKKGAL